MIEEEIVGWRSRRKRQDEEMHSWVSTFHNDDHVMLW